MMTGEGMSIPSSSTLPPLFTIEQIELIRRLRNTGITKQEVIYAFDSLDRLYSELGMLSKPSTVASSQSIYKDTSPQKTVTLSKTELCQTPPIRTQNGGHVIQSCDSNGFDLIEESCSNLSATSSVDYNVLGNTPVRHPGNSQPMHSLNTMNPVHSVSEEELSEFMEKGEDVICDEIRGFVRHNQITQSHIAFHSGISQSYVSRYLRGDYCDMSETSCRGIYLWYLNAKRKSSNKTESFIFTSISGCNSGEVISNAQTELTPLATSPEGLNFLPHRRERFTFKQCHLQILETYFSQNQYPTAEKREMIATACNEALISVNIGQPLTDREKVYPHIVANWFANRRKELKKTTKDGVPESSPNNSTGRSRWRSTSVESLNTMPLSDDKLLNIDQLDSQSLSMAVEVAAVNQAILSLTG